MQTWLERAGLAEIYGDVPVGASPNYVYAGKLSDIKETIVRGLRSGLATAAIVAAIGAPYIYRDRLSDLIDRMRGNEMSITEQDLIDTMQPQELNPSVMEVPDRFDGVEYKTIASELSGVEGNRNYVYDDKSVGAKPWSESKIGNPTIGIGHLMTQDKADRKLFSNLFGTEVDYDKLMNNTQKLTDPQVMKLFKHDSESRILWALNTFPNFKNFNAATQAAIISAKYRGDMGPETIALINKGDWAGAADEFLDHREYKEVKRKVKNGEKTNKRGIIKRLEDISQVFRNNAS